LAHSQAVPLAPYNGPMSEGHNSTKPYVVKWHEGDSDQYRWFIRGIHPDGSFYGEIQFVDEQRSANVEGSLSAEDRARVFTLIAQLEQEPLDASDNSPWQGLLADSLAADAHVICRYRWGLETTSDLLFLGLIGVLAPYLRIHY